MPTGINAWSTTPANNATIDQNAQFTPGMSANALDGALRGLMASVAITRDDNLGVSLVTTGGANNAFTLQTGQSLIDPASTAGGGVAKITHPFSLRINFNAAPTGLATKPLTLAIDGAAAATVTRADGTPVVDGDIKTTRSYPIVGYAFTNGALSQIRIITTLRSDGLSASSLGGSVGYRVYDDGTVENWGYSSASGDTTITFQKPFPNACRAVVANASQGVTASAFVVMVSTITPTSFIARPRQIDPGGTVSQASCPISWHAVGF